MKPSPLGLYGITTLVTTRDLIRLNSAMHSLGGVKFDCCHPQTLLYTVYLLCVWVQISAYWVGEGFGRVSYPVGNSQSLSDAYLITYCYLQAGSKSLPDNVKLERSPGSYLVTLNFWTTQTHSLSPEATTVAKRGNMIFLALLHEVTWSVTYTHVRHV